MLSLFMQLPGIKGSATDVNHKGWIPISTKSFTKSRQVLTRSGRNVGRETSPPNFTYLEIEKPMDESSPLLFKAFNEVKHFEKMVIDVCQTTESGLQTYLQYTFYDVILNFREVSIAAGEGNHPGQAAREQLRWSYTKVEERFIPHNAGHQSGSPVTASYNIVTAEVG